MTSEDLTVNEKVIIDNILNRTSVRDYNSTRPIPVSIQNDILHAGMSAPSACDRRPWTFVIVDDPTILRQLAAALPYAKMAANAPLAIIPCGDSSRFLPGEDSSLWIQDLAAASENILLSAQAFGLGAVWTSVYPHADRQHAVSRILNLPDSIIPFNVIPIGYPNKPHTPHDKWDPARIHHNRW